MTAALYQYDRDKPVKFTITVDSDVDGTTVDSVRVIVESPRSGTEAEWTVAIDSGETTTALVVVNHTLASDGSDLPEHGDYVVRAWLYTGATLVDDSLEGTFTVLPARVTWPT